MIKIQDINYQYKNSDPILNHINLEVEEGECICIIGQNGSGKSTLARLIAGINTQTSGKIIIDDMDISNKANIIELRRKVGIVFQNPENQILFGNVYDDIAFGLKNMGFDNIDQRITQALKEVGMLEYKNKDAYELSLGQKQRITIASVLAFHPKYIVFDEPTTMLDSKGKEDVYGLMKQLKQEGYTIIYITNVMEEILLADKILVLDKGNLVAQIKKENLIENINILEEIHMKLPFVVQTILELKKQGIEIILKDWTKEELIDEIVKEYRR